MTQSVSNRLSDNPQGSWRILVIAFLAFNFAIGLPLGSFGVSVLAIEKEFDTSRALASAGASLVILAFGLMGPVIAWLIERFSIRSTMLVGVVLGSIGYVALWAAPNIWVFLACFGLLVGPAVAMAGNMPASVLINNWFRFATGRAIGIMMMPLFIMLVPMVSSPIIENFGLRTLYLTLAATNLLMVPLLLLVNDRPSDAFEAEHAASQVTAVPRLAMGQILGRMDLWLLILAYGLLNGSGMVKLSHLVPLLSEQGRSVGEATLLLSISGGAGVLGSIAFGWIADRVGGAVALMLNGLLQAATWSIFLLHPGMGLLLVDAFIMGACGGGVFAAFMVVLVDLFGRQNVPRTLGLAGLFGMIPTFVAPPIAGYLYDYAGSYSTVLAAISTACLAVALVMGMLRFRQRKIEYTPALITA